MVHAQRVWHHLPCRHLEHLAQPAVELARAALLDVVDELLDLFRLHKVLSGAVQQGGVRGRGQNSGQAGAGAVSSQTHLS